MKAKRKKAYNDLLRETNVNTTSNWKDIRRKIKEDARFLKFSSSDRKREREFNEFIQDLGKRARVDFQEMLEECRLITYETEGILTLTCPIGLPPHAPVSQKNADQR